MKEMWEIVRAYGWRQTVADLVVLACICITLYALTVGAALVTP